ncbi:hypothetical protein F2P81_006018 [Xyrichtys novacula]|uniref:CCHC-type domain-containing protein n=1 Tax=Xyrichtys novacula TaxID=13765 RepID=A0AAV1FG03_XYRNO|nr:hypothetical protein F2P81_006018 [Xyrichtys novacula]
MQLGRARLTQEERRKRLLEGRCFYCSEAGHLVVTCPAKQASAVSQFEASKPVSRTLTKVQLIHHTVNNLEELIDSGADESLMDCELVEKLGIRSEPLTKPIRARALDGKELFVNSRITEPLHMHIKDH